MHSPRADDGPATVAPGVLAWVAGDHIVVDTAREMVLTTTQALAMAAALAHLARAVETTRRLGSR
jgi:hypothetical protein